jgi:hypothetical protein
MYISPKTDSGSYKRTAFRAKKITFLRNIGWERGDEIKARIQEIQQQQGFCGK